MISFHLLQSPNCQFAIFLRSTSDNKIWLNLILSQFPVSDPTSPQTILFRSGKNRKILYKIKDSKRTMKNTKKKDNKPLKKIDLAAKKPPPLQFTQPINTQQFNEGALLKTLLPSASSKLMQGFSSTQKKIISEEFGKMIKTLKKKLTSPQKMQNSNRSKFETKTQRFEYPDPSNTRDTVKKTITTQRKFPNSKTKIQSKIAARQPVITSPKKSARNQSLQLESQECRGSEIGSPAKNKRLGESKKHGKLQKSKRKNTSSENENQGIRNGTYMLMGDTFVEVDDGEVKQMQLGIIHQPNSLMQPDIQIEQIWKQFLSQKKKIHSHSPNEKDEAQISKPLQKSRQKRMNIKCAQPMQTNACDEHIKSINQSQCSSVISKVLINSKVQPHSEQSKQLQLNNKLFYEEFYNGEEVHPDESIDLKQGFRGLMTNNEQGQNCRQVTSLQQAQSQYSYDSSYLANSPMCKSPYEQSLKARTNAISLQMKTNQQILSRLLQSSKIDKKQYQKYMDIVVEMYDKEMTETEKLREIIDSNQQKIDELIKSTNQGLRMSEKLQDVEVEALLGNVLGGYGKVKQNEQIVKSQDTHHQKQSQDYLCFNKSHLYETHFQKSETKIQPQTSKAHQSVFTSSIKIKIEQRIASQLNIIPSTNQNPQKQCISTSILSVYQFIKSFYTFLTSHHLDEFLMYVNMPYGYSVEQRLRYMQGYDDDENNQPAKNQIIYGLEEVIRPALLEMYYKSFIYQNQQQRKDNARVSQWQKLHNRVIFDGINQAINRFRPYYTINGCPYQWTTSEKALTYYFIRQDCYQQLLQKVQIQVLKWSSSLCGLIIQQPTCSAVVPNSTPMLSIQQIFERYTIQTPNQLLQHREQKIIKQQKIQTQQTNFQWLFHDEFKTALLYQISSCLLEDLANQCSLMMLVGCELGMADILELIYQCGMRKEDMI